MFGMPIHCSIWVPSSKGASQTSQTFWGISTPLHSIPLRVRTRDAVPRPWANDMNPAGQRDQGRPRGDPSQSHAREGLLLWRGRPAQPRSGRWGEKSPICQIWQQVRPGNSFLRATPWRFIRRVPSKNVKKPLMLIFI